MTDAFKWPSLLRHFLKCLPNQSLREQPLPPVQDVFGMGWKVKRRFKGAAAGRDAAEDDRRPRILQLSTKWLTPSTINVIEQLAYKNKALVLVL